VDALRDRIDRGRRLIAAGNRPLYHVTTTYDGAAVDVRVRELPIVHLFIPGTEDALEGARGLIARTLDVSPASFDVTAAAPGSRPPADAT
jgi:hypothetical protein